MKRYSLTLVAMVAFAVIIFYNLNYDVMRIEQPLLIPPTESIRHFTFGYNESFSDSLWINSIQHYGACEQMRGGTSKSTSGAQMGLDRTPSCSQGYLYHLLSLILDLVPRFKLASRSGPIVLSVIIDDIDGATLLFKKAMRNYPDDWVIASRAAYHYVFELEDLETGAGLYYRAATIGGPSWMAAYASKLESQNGRNDVAKKMLTSFMKANDLSETEKKMFLNKLKYLEAETHK